MRKTMGTKTRVLGALAALVAMVAGAACSPAAAGDGWRADAVWDDGKAEYAAYEVSWARYGTHFPGRALLILVKEPWAPDLEVKADTPRADGFEVLKLNHIRDVPTGIYTYHQMASVFLRRDSGEVRKLATSSTEGCGISTAEMVGGRLRASSYFDGQGVRVTPWPAGALPEDGLPALLRGYVTGPLPRSVEVFPSLLTGRFPPLEAASWQLERRPASRVTVPAGTFEGVELRLERDGRFLAYTFAAEPPHVLLAHETGDGTTYRLAKVERLAYWNLNRPGGEAWWPRGPR